MPFIGRECEKQKIIKLAANDNFELLFIYGKRRIGKTETIKESLKNIEGKIIYFCAIKNNPNLNLSSFCQCVFASFDELKEMQTT
jgi:AAA+ ATPase superfamily predicted ATPase